MPYEPDKHHRRSTRLPGYNYAQAGAYFVTIVTQRRECLFGDVIDGEMQLNEYGQIVAEEWMRTADIRPNVSLDAFIVMPNHIHGIIVIGRGTLQLPLRKNGLANRPPILSPRSSVCSKQPPPNASMQGAACLVLRSGSAVIMSTLFAMKNRSGRFLSTSKTTHCNEYWTMKTQIGYQRQTTP